MLAPIITFLQKLVEIPSLSPLDLGCQSVISQKLISLGFKVEQININKTSNLWAERGYGKTLVFLGHTDVVPAGNIDNWQFDPFKLTIKRKKIFGRGVADMKGAIAAMIFAVEDIILKKLLNHNGRISFLITSDEESSGIDGTIKVVEQLIKRGEKIDFCLVGEPTSEFALGDTIKNGRRGSLNAKLYIYGIQGHIAYPDLSDNPIHKSLLFLSKLINYKWNDGNDFFPSTQLQIYNIDSNNQISNMIPNKLCIEFNLRFSPETTVDILKSTIEKLLNTLRINYSISWFLSAIPFYSKPEKLLSVVMQAITQIQKITPKMSTNGGTSDARFISKMNSEIVELGFLNKTIHQSNENISISDLKNLKLIYKNIIENLFK